MYSRITYEQPNRDLIKHEIKLFVIGFIDIEIVARLFPHYTEISHFNLLTEWINQTDLVLRKDSTLYYYNIENIVEGSKEALAKLEDYAETKCNQLVSEYCWIIDKINEQIEKENNPNKIYRRKTD